LIKIPAERIEAHEQALAKVAPGSTVAPGSLLDEQGRPVVDQVVCADSIAALNAAPEGWADLVFADPPFNIGYLYHGYDDRLKTDDYLKFSADWMRAVHRALKPNGSFYLAIGDDYVADLCVIARRKIGFNMRNWIIWHYTFGQQTKMKFAKSHTHILYFTKDALDFTFNPDAVRVASARQTTYNDARANAKGKLPDDTWYLRPQETPEPFFDAGCDTWNVSRVCGTFKEREGWHGCQMPMGVLNRIILASSNPGDVVLDPFNGSGTTSVAAALLGRRYVGIDQSPQYVEHARKRLQSTMMAMDAKKQQGAIAPEGSAQDLAAMATEAATGDRQSRLFTDVDAFGRKRVAR
jgi:site-specific DNA-methyltransferase (adenine-specific)